MSNVRYFEFIDDILNTQTVEDVHSVCSRICENYGFDHFLYAASIPTSFVKPYVIIIGGYPPEWRQHYNDMGYQSIDPTVIHCVTRVVPMAWDGLEPLAREDKKLRQFMGDAFEFGLVSGVSFPVHGSRGEAAMLSLASNDKPEKSKSRIQQSLPEVNLLAGYVHEAASRIVVSERVELEKVQLTDREQECLLWATEGKTSWETSQILGISERTVIFHLQNASKKLNVVNRQQAVARAVAMGLIRPQLN